MACVWVSTKVDNTYTVEYSPEFGRWLRKLRDARARALVVMRIRRLSCGHTGDLTVLGHGLMELRLHYGPGFRVYFTQVDPGRFIVLCGGEKGSQKRDITLARRLAGKYRGKGTDV